MLRHVLAVTAVLAGGVLLAQGVRPAQAQSFEALEQFLRADSLEQAVAELVPGSLPHDYYACLWLQGKQRYDEVDQWLIRWRERHGESPLWRQIRHRQALLTYQRDHGATLTYLRDALGLTHAHQAISRAVAERLPSRLDPALISEQTLTARALAGRDDLAKLEDSALFRLGQSGALSAAQRRELLTRLPWPDLPNLATLAADDLRAPRSGGFGALPIHHRMTLPQLDQLLQRVPELLQQENFINEYLKRLKIDNAEDSEDLQVRGRFLDRVWAFVRRLGPSHRSLRAHVLYHRMQWNREQGKYPKDLFLEYVRTPRQSPWLNDQWMREQKDGLAQLDADYRPMTGLPSIGDESELVRDYLEHLLVDAPNYDEYSPYLSDALVKQVFAETKLMFARGDAAAWQAMLSNEQSQRLLQRVELMFPASQVRDFPLEQPVVVDLWVKNAPQLLVKIYELNTEAYYREQGRELDASVDLDGLAATWEQKYEYPDPAIRRIQRRFEFPQLDHPGVFVIDFLGNGRSSRVLVRKGGWRMLSQPSAGGILCTVVDKQGDVVPHARLILGQQQWTTDSAGQALIPYSTQPSTQRMVLLHQGVASLATFNHAAETYELRAAFQVSRESLLSERESLVLVRPQLLLASQPISLQAVREAALTIASTDQDGLSAVKVVENFALRENQESVGAFVTPPRLKELTFTLNVKVWSQSLQREETLTASHTVRVNAGDSTDVIVYPELARTADGYVIDLLGRTGETFPTRAVTVRLKHRDFRDPVETRLMSDANGRIHLGELQGVVSLTVSQPNSGAPDASWSLSVDRAESANRWNRAAGQEIVLPHLSPLPTASREDYVLLKAVAGVPVEDHFAALSVADGMLRIRGLPAGDYQLVVKRAASGPRIIDIQVLAGSPKAGYWISNTRAMQQRSAPAVQISDMQVNQDTLSFRVSNADRFTRVHVVACRFQSELDALELLALHDAAPLTERLPRLHGALTAGRVLGDELQYILDRRRAARFPGNMLERPSLLLNPHAVADTRTDRQEAAPGVDAAPAQDRPAASPQRMAGKKVAQNPQGETPAGDFANLDFLPQTALILANLQPDEQGRIELKREALGERRQLRIIAVHPDNGVIRELALPAVESKHRDLRLSRSFDKDAPLARQRRLLSLNPGDSLTIDPAVSMQLQFYASLRDVFQYYLSVTRNERLAEYETLLTWNDLSLEKKREFYSLRACHELHFFLYHKDREFFDDVVRPYLSNKLQRTFLDRWLLEEDLHAYLDPWAYARLNALERVLLARRLPQWKEATRRGFADQLALQAAASAAIIDAAIESAWASRGLEAESMIRLGVAPTIVPSKELPDLAGLQLESRNSGVMTYSIQGQDGRTDKGAANNRWAAPQEKALVRGSFQDNGVTNFYFSKLADADTKLARRLFVQVERTQEWAENNYDRLTFEQQTPELAPVSAFWRDYAMHEDGLFLSGNFISAKSSFTEMMLALAVLDLPPTGSAPVWEREHGADRRERKVAIATPMIAVRQSLEAAQDPQAAARVMMTQQFFRADDPTRLENGVQVDKLVADEFLTSVVYGGRVIVSNATSAQVLAELLVQIPQGAIPVRGGKEVQHPTLILAPYSVQTFEYFFYFPGPGEFTTYGATASRDGKLLGAADSRLFRVVREATLQDRKSWLWVSQEAEADEVLRFLEEEPLIDADLSLLAFRMRDKQFYLDTLQRLRQRLLFDATLWSYSLLHDDERGAREYLQHRDEFVTACGARLESPLLVIDPVQRGTLEHLEYKPLVNARRHVLGDELRILNDRFAQQYRQLLDVFCQQASLTDDDRLAWTYYLLLQDRVADAWAQFEQVELNRVSARMQYDYCQAYFAFSFEQPDAARSIVQRYENYAVDRWRDAFAMIQQQLDELDGKQVESPEKESQSVEQLSRGEPVLELAVDGDVVRVDYRNLSEIEVGYYRMDIEVLFSRDPFVATSSSQFTLVRPATTQRIALPAGSKSHQWKLPPEIGRENVLVEVRGQAAVQRKLRLATTLSVRMMPRSGLLEVRDSAGAAASKAYVKVFARFQDGSVRFYKDGYTDLRGRFDYASLSTDDLDRVERFAVLVLSDQQGAVVKEEDPPAR